MAHSYSHSQSPQNQYYLITNVSGSSSSSSKADKEIDLNTQSWKLPYNIDDSDLMFDGKPLNMLYEESSRRALTAQSSHQSRGRSRSRK